MKSHEDESANSIPASVVQKHRFLQRNHGFRVFGFFEILVHRDARARAPARVVLDHGDLVYGGARARPRESSPTMHGVLVHRGARPRESSPTMHGGLEHRGARPRESSPTMDGVLVHRGARPRIYMVDIYGGYMSRIYLADILYR